MKNTIKAALLSAALILTSCVPSLNPLYTDADLVSDDTLPGVWIDQEATESWAFTASKDKEYDLVYTDERGKKGEFKAHLLKIEGKLFLDLTPVKSSLSQNDFFRSNLLAAHTFVHVSKTAPNPQISYLEPEWLKSYLAKNPAALRHEKMSGEILLTASTRELQKFLLAHLDTPGAFSSPVAIKRK